MLENTLELQVRLKLLHRVVDAYAKAFGADKSSLEIIKKGILDRQLIEKIFIVYYNKKNKILSEIVIEIDWEKHKIRASDKKGMSLLISDNESILSKLDKATKVMVNHTKKIMRDYKIKKISCLYMYKQEIYSNSQKNQEANEYLGVSESNLDKNNKEDLYNEFSREIAFVIDHIDEVKVTIRNS